MTAATPPLPHGQLTFTVDQAAAVLGISKSTAYESAHRGELPVLRFGRRLVVTRATLETLLGMNQLASTTNQANERRARGGPSGYGCPMVESEPTRRTGRHHTDVHQRGEDPQAQLDA